ncbi:MAG: hypothetical protein WC223_13600 [Bacteroidales bacterium]|jgi:hypothetical protein
MRKKLEVLKEMLSEIKELRELYYDAYERTDDRRFIEAYYYHFHKEITIRGKIFDDYNNFKKTGKFKKS